LVYVLLADMAPPVVAQDHAWAQVRVGDFVIHYQPYDLPLEELEPLIGHFARVRKQVVAALELSPRSGLTPVYLINSEGTSGVTEEGIIVLRREHFTQSYGPIAHLITRALMRQVAQTTSPLLQEGVAVYKQERFGQGDFYPAYGRPLDLYCAGFLRLNMLLPLRRLEETYAFGPTERPTVRKTSRWQAFIQAGSFVKYLIERYGPTLFKAAYAGAGYEEVYEKSLAELETEWVAAVAAPRLAATQGQPLRLMLPADNSLLARKEFALVMVLPDTVAAGYTFLPQIAGLPRPVEQPTAPEFAPPQDMLGARDDPAVVARRQAASEALLRGAEAFDAGDYAAAREAFAAAQAVYQELGDEERLALARELAEGATRAQVRRQRTLVTLGIGLATLVIAWLAGLTAVRRRQRAGGVGVLELDNDVVWDDVRAWPDEDEPFVNEQIGGRPSASVDGVVPASSGSTSLGEL
jgi:hypothetical protein